MNILNKPRYAISLYCHRIEIPMIARRKRNNQFWGEFGDSLHANVKNVNVARESLCQRIFSLPFWLRVPNSDSILFFWTHFCKLSSIEAIIRVNHMRLRSIKHTHNISYSIGLREELHKSQLDWTKISENDNYRTPKTILSFTIIPISILIPIPISYNI